VVAGCWGVQLGAQGWREVVVVGEVGVEVVVRGAVGAGVVVA
jgi:hypothetical protein